jgi:ankyrin repeat protein
MKRLIPLFFVLVLPTVLFAQNANAQGSKDFFQLVKTGTPQSVQAAISKGADVNAQNKGGLSPLMFAARYNQSPEVIMTLLKAGADAKAKNRHGKTAFDYAQKNASLKDTDAYRQLQEASQ